ncbi:c-type cytochrome [Roseovarius autotrophicus]|uniref:c-type cytochrome n=1 Tax=Roseovarius autotrophicus TaxID=2824121 RepID=UPI0019F59F16|nr:cytochrome C [Roseovarius autotrophicus]MBE0454477.1 cytochrome C [Roseovarius sp.]
MRQKLTAILVVLAAGTGLPASAADPQRGERLFNDCRACHAVIDETGKVRERGGRTGPNLFGVIGRHAGSVPGFHYSTSMVAAGQNGLRWNEADFVVYVRDATAFLRDYLSDPSARGKMAYKLPDETKARDIWAYLERVSTP